LDEVNMADSQYKLPTEFTVMEYKCGLKAGDKVKLICDIIIRDDYGLPTGVAYAKGEIWDVQPGAKDKTVVVWFRRADGKLHTWNDDEAIYKTFQKVEES
jgi:hypothetical protein